MLTRRKLFVAGATVLGCGAVGASFLRSNALAQTAEAPGPWWGLAIDVPACTAREGCRACIDACHVAHRVTPVPDVRHRVEWIWKEPFERVFPEQTHAYTGETQRRLTLPVLCNHCQHPPCTRVCPTGATWQRADGVVAMDPHRCIGCRYCMAACPYGARSFNWSSATHPATSNYPARAVGVVEKCTLCAERLDLGQEPTCVEACRRAGGAALVFGDLKDPNSEIRRVLSARNALRRKPSLGTEPRVFYLT